MAAREEGTAKMTAFARRQPLRQLAEALEILDRKPRLDNAERLTRAVLMDVICERSPAADAALERWRSSLQPSPVRYAGLHPLAGSSDGQRERWSLQVAGVRAGAVQAVGPTPQV